MTPERGSGVPWAGLWLEGATGVSGRFPEGCGARTNRAMATDMSSFPFEQTRALLLEYLKDKPSGQFQRVVAGVVELAVSKGLHTPPPGRQRGDGRSLLKGTDAHGVPELIRQQLWQLLVQGVLVFGMNEDNPNWPWYRLTEYGVKVAQATGPQPYDPTGFLADFTAKNPGADPVILDYLTEAVTAFNHGCPKSAAVMMGAASEKALLLLHDAFQVAITDTSKKAIFDRDSRKSWTIHSKYRVLKDRLDQMVAAKKLAGDLRDTISFELPAGFDLIRRQRNAAGHPEIVANHDPDAVFLNLRVMTEYIRRVYLLIDHFDSNPADW